MKKHQYEIGQVYGVQQLTGLYHDEHNQIIAKTRCVLCGRESERRARSLFNAKHTSCKCRIETVDGLSSSRIYGIYYNMLDRCNNPRCMSYEAYGARGIRVCEEWSGVDGFTAFYKWSMEHGYTNTMTIDRVKSDGDYCPSNCQWITKSENTARANVVQHRRANNGEYYGVSPEGKGYRFENANQFAREHPELNPANIRKCANGGAKSHRGWIFGFVSQLSSREPQSTIESTANSGKQVEYGVSETLAPEAPSACNQAMI